MKITSCASWPGPGAVARYGGLLAVTDGRGPGAGLLLSVLGEVAAAGGDGSDLVRAAARAALGCPGQPAWACAGVTARGGVAVLVNGTAAASVRVAGDAGLTLTAGDSVIPVSRTFAGTAVTLRLAAGPLASGELAEPDPRCWLGRGVVPGGGLAVTASADVADPTAMPAPAVVELPPPAVAEPSADSPEPVLVEGVLCDRGHFNDLGARACRQCGAGLEPGPRVVQRGPRPPLGVLALDDGTRVTLDGDYVFGREPALDADVIAGRARPVRISDPEGTVSRLHLKISLVGWRVEVSDLGSANGSVLRSPGGKRTLTPFQPEPLEPDTWIGVGHRSMQYLAYQGVTP
jgi:hypothetical protein